MFDRWTFGISSVLVAFILVVLGGRLTQAAQMEGMDMGHYRLNMATNPAVVEANQSFSMILNIYQADGTTPVTEFDEVHTKLLHLILVSEDLTEFLHLHPEYEGDGTFVLDDTLLPKTANYVVFADFTPTGDEQQVIRTVLITDGAEAITPELAVSADSFTAGTLKVDLKIPATVNAGQDTLIGFHVTNAESGDPIDNLDKYLGAAGHLVILDNTSQVYIHTHPAEAEGSHDMHNMAGMETQYGTDVQFAATFPATGLYAMWLQVQYEGEVYTFPFVVDVTGEATPEATAEAHSGHG
ncbi:MAG: hypothetical protein K8L97_19985 [Anaerolineae bacterium]|nr:hypothetical protein [Anaerolineae bacterium]